MGAEPGNQPRSIMAGMDAAIERAASKGTSPRAFYLTKEDHDRLEAEALDLWRDHNGEDGTFYVSVTTHRGVPVRIGRRSHLYATSGQGFGVKQPPKERPKV